jgi:hypothetical protein
VVAELLGLTHQTIGEWRRSFVERRLSACSISGERAGHASVSDAQVERVVRMTFGERQKTPLTGPLVRW